MAHDIANDEIRDTNTHTYPVRVQHGRVVFQYYNDLDAEVTVEVWGTYEEDTNYKHEVKLGDTTLSADSSGRDALTDPWDRVRFKAAATNAPTEDSLIIKEHA